MGVPPVKSRARCACDLKPTHYSIVNLQTSPSLLQQIVMTDDNTPFPDPVVIEITDVFDLHTISPRDVKAVVEEYLYQAHGKGFPVVRIIHGKGIGVQRELVRTILARTDFVFDWTDAPPEAGGPGATIVRFKTSADSAD